VIVVSMLLVVVGFVTLLLGVFQVGDQPLQFVYASIISCVVAAVLLVVGVVRNRPSRKPAVAAGGDVRQASWSGAAQGAADTDGPLPPPAPEPAAPKPAALDTQQTERLADSTTPIYPPDDEDWAPRRDAAVAPPAEPGTFERLLDAVEGVTPARRDAIQAEFGSAEALGAASIEQLAGVRGVSVSLAKRIHDALRP
jgi:hypothetical protein